MPDDEIDVQDDAGAAVEAGEAADEQIQPGEPGYVQKRLDRLKRQRTAAEERAAKAEGANAELRARLEALENRPILPVQPEEREPSIDDDLAKATKFLEDVEQVRLIAQSDPNEERRQKAAEQLANVKGSDIVFAIKEVSRATTLKAAKESEKRMSTQLEGQQAKQAFKERIVREFGPDAVNAKSDLFQLAGTEYRELIQSFPDDASGAVTWMALEKAKAKLDAKNRAGRGSDLDRRRLAIEGSTRREGEFANKIAALKTKGDSASQLKAVNLELDAFLKANGYTTKG